MTAPRSALLALGLALAGGPDRAGADGPPDGHVRDVIYGRKAGLALTLDAYPPTVPPNGAGVLWLASGSFQSQDPDERFYAELRGRGYVVFAVRHGSAPIFTAEEAVTDAHRAVRFLRREAGRFGVDPERLAVVGISSGGLLAAHVGVCGGDGPESLQPDVSRLGRYDPVEQEPSRVAAFVSICGPADLLDYGGAGRPVTEHRFPPEARVDPGFLRDMFRSRDYERSTRRWPFVTDPEEVRRRLRAISPAARVTRDSSPGLLIHGRLDEYVPVQQAALLADRMRAVGVPVELIVRDRDGHGVYRDGDGALIADWLDRRLTAPPR